MQLERIAIVLRARSAWEAIDLGFRMAMRWVRPLWLTWFAVFAPVALVLCIALREHAWLAALLLWWLLPVFERFLLHVLAHAVFGAPPALAQTLSEWRSILRGGLWSTLLLRPLAWRRSFVAPIAQLEGQRGRAALARRRVLLRRVEMHVVGLAFICLLFVASAVIGVEGLIELLTPGHVSDAAGDSGLSWQMRDTLLLVAALSLIEPLYVAGGFALYLSRRVQLEGWDIELGLRRLAQTATPARPRWAASMGIAALLLGALLSSPVRAAPGAVEAAPERAQALEAESQPTGAPPQYDGPARRAIVAILADREFGAERRVTRWQPRERDQREVDGDWGWLRALGRWIAGAAQWLAWLVLIGLALAMIAAIARHWQRRHAQPAGRTAPAVLFGLAITPESLPDDVGAVARAALVRGDLREALSLLYRGALSHLVHDRGITIGEGATEGDVLRIVEAGAAAPTAGWFAQLLPAWIALAYGKQMPAPVIVERLCAQYPSLFGAADRTPT